MAWHLTTDVAEYAAAAWPLLAADPVRFTWQLSAIANVSAGGPVPGAWFGWWPGPDGRAVAVASLVPPHPLLVAAAGDVLPDGAAAALVAACQAGGHDLTGVEGDPSSTAQVAACWCHAAAGTATLDYALRLFRLERLVPPHDVPGTGTVAQGDDLTTVWQWALAFASETGLPGMSQAALMDRASYGGWLLWRGEDGVPVAMAGLSRPDGGVTRIGMVYTPVARRGRGFAGAVTAYAVMRAAPGEVALVTDLTNATSNGVYARLGFKAFADRTSFRLSRPVAGPGGRTGT